MAGKSGISLAMAFFGKKEGQGIKDFKDEWDAISDEGKAQLTAGLSDGTLTYADQ
jgi:hypothetical protein